MCGDPVLLHHGLGPLFPGLARRRIPLPDLFQTGLRNGAGHTASGHHTALLFSVGQKVCDGQSCPSPLQFRGHLGQLSEKGCLHSQHGFASSKRPHVLHYVHVLIQSGHCEVPKSPDVLLTPLLASHAQHMALHHLVLRRTRRHRQTALAGSRDGRPHGVDAAELAVGETVAVVEVIAGHQRQHCLTMIPHHPPRENMHENA